MLAGILVINIDYSSKLDACGMTFKPITETRQGDQLITCLTMSCSSPKYIMYSHSTYIQVEI